MVDFFFFGIKMVSMKKKLDFQFNDIAILRLVSPVAYSDTISPICLPVTGYFDGLPGKQAVVIGWGSLSDGISRILLIIKWNSSIVIQI